jgi:hypothetical protein
MDQDYNATASFFAEKSLKARDLADKERFSRLAAEYRGKALVEAAKRARTIENAIAASEAISNREL